MIKCSISPTVKEMQTTTKIPKSLKLTRLTKPCEALPQGPAEGAGKLMVRLCGLHRAALRQRGRKSHAGHSTGTLKVTTPGPFLLKR